MLRITDNVVIKDGEYTLGPTAEMCWLLSHGEELLDIINDPDFNLI